MSGTVLLALARLTSLPRFSPALEVTRLDVHISGLPVALEGFTIAHISDLHVGAGAWGPMRRAEAATALRTEPPDLVVNTGDYLQGEPPIPKVLEIARPFVIQERSTTQGAVNLAVLGNHDYYAGDEAVSDLRTGLEHIGVRLLINDVAHVVRDGASIAIAGVTEREDGFEETVLRLSGCPPPRILIVHEGDLSERLAEGAVDLILAGHTHGGQIALPGMTPSIVRRFNGSKFIEGWYRVNGNWMYINRGLGCTGLPMRFRAAPQVTFLRLRR